MGHKIMLSKTLMRLSVGSAIGALIFTTVPVFAVSNVPIEFYPNYEIAEELEDMVDVLVNIESLARVEGNVESINFGELHKLFTDIFEYFPSSPSNRILYESCKSVTSTLSQQFELNDYYVFKDRCFAPLNDLINEINNNYTVKTRIKVDPDDGPAPLNVTLDARGSIDPSQDTIPSDNFLWYYKDVQGDDQPIGKGPVINHTFDDPGLHVVHLTVRSANNLSQGIFDGAETVNVNVAPRAAVIAVYVNGKRLDTDDILRIGTQEAKNGIYFDGTATTPIGQRTILNHKWQIKGKQGQQFDITRSGDGPPDQFLLRFPENGVYTVRLDIEDNQGNRLAETYEISVSDPVASIRLQPEDGTTSDLYTFDASASYSLSSRVATTQWIITDSNGDRIDTVESKVLKKKFTKPGIYNVKLTVTDELGNQSFDTEQFTVGSTPPIPSFTVTPTSDLEYPSKFILDATPTYDVDASNNADELSYAWSFSSNDQVAIENEQNNGRTVTATFNSPGDYTVRLLVEDAYGETVEIEKRVEVESTLRPELIIDPVVGQWGDLVQFVSKTNKPVAFYERDFGDGIVERENSPRVTHSYDQAGIYPVKLTVITDDGEQNSLTRQVFVGQQDLPTLGYEVYKTRDVIMTKSSTCTNSSGDKIPAYEVTRYENMSIDLALSRNLQGTQFGLNYQFRPQNDEVYTRRSFNYNFPVLGCSRIDVYVEDTSKSLTVTDRIWFDVKNALPVLDNLVVDFPQPGGGNSIGIGLTEANTPQRDIFGDESIDPIVVRLSARGVRDPDGVVSHFIWYYYPSSDPERILGLKVTPGDVNFTNFVIPKPYSPTEYAFGVRLVDNDDGEIRSEDVLGKGPLVFFPPGVNNLDIPIVSLKASPVNAKVGDAVTFTAESSILSEKPDFDSARYYKYDFDGDGEIDLTTKKATVQYAYSEPGEKYPKVQVYYRGRAGVGGSERIFVQRGVNPVFVYDQYDKKVLVRQMSQGDLEIETLCMDIRRCVEDPEWIIESERLFLFEYDEYGDYFPKQSVIDTFGNESSSRAQITLSEPPADTVGLLSIPQGIPMSGGVEIAVGNSLDNTIAYYLDYPDDTCFIDNDITVDTDQDGDPTLDRDIPCNELIEQPYYPVTEEQYARLYYVQDGQLKEVEILLSFIDYEEIVNEDFKRAYEQIDKLLADIQIEENDDVLKYYRDLLINLRTVLGEEAEMSSLVIQLRELLTMHPGMVSTEHKQQADTFLTTLSDSTVQSVFGGTVYDTAKTNVLSWLSPAAKTQAGEYFLAFERANGDQDAMKYQLDLVFTLAADERSASRIDDIDFVDIQRNLCDMIVYYELPSATCGTAVEAIIDTEDIPDSTTSGTSILWRILRVVLRVVLALGMIIVAIIVFFAIRAKNQSTYVDGESEQDDEDDSE